MLIAGILADEEGEALAVYLAPIHLARVHLHPLRQVAHRDVDVNAPSKSGTPLMLATSRGFQHSSIPLAARMVEEMGKKTGAWTTDVTYHAAAINPQTLANYDAIFLSSTTGTFLDEPNPFGDPAITALNEARRKAFMDFVRGGKLLYLMERDAAVGLLRGG